MIDCLNVVFCHGIRAIPFLWRYMNCLLHNVSRDRQMTPKEDAKREVGGLDLGLREFRKLSSQRIYRQAAVTETRNHISVPAPSAHTSQRRRLSNILIIQCQGQTIHFCTAVEYIDNLAIKGASVSTVSTQFQRDIPPTSLRSGSGSFLLRPPTMTKRLSWVIFNTVTCSSTDRAVASRLPLMEYRYSVCSSGT